MADPVLLALLGFGNVGQALAELLLEKRDPLQERYGIEWRVVGIGTGRHGAALDPNGIDLKAALSTLRAGGSLDALSSAEAPESGLEFVQACRADVLFENTPVNYETGQPAVDHLRAALERGMHAITANKGPVVHAYHELNELAGRQGRRFLFESTVMDGAPLFSLWREALPAADLLSFRGILNSTTNLILTLMEDGKSFSEAVAHAQAIGIAETDPRGDVEGWDAAIKVAAMATVLMGAPLKPAQVERNGIETLTLDDVASAKAAGRRWKLVCEATRTPDGVQARVAPVQVGPEDPLFQVMGTSSAVTYRSDVLGALTVMEEDPGPRTTAYGLLADFVRAVL